MKPKNCWYYLTDAGIIRFFVASKGKKSKKITHMWRRISFSEFPFGIYWWTLKNPKNQNFEKMKKNCWIYFTHEYQKPQSYEVHFQRYGMRWFFFISGHFLPFKPPLHCLTTQKTKILKKWKKHLEMSSF